MQARTHVFLLELAGQVALDERRLAGAAVADEDQLWRLINVSFFCGCNFGICAISNANGNHKRETRTLNVGTLSVWPAAAAAGAAGFIFARLFFCCCWTLAVVKVLAFGQISVSANLLTGAR